MRGEMYMRNPSNDPYSLFTPAGIEEFKQSLIVGRTVRLNSGGIGVTVASEPRNLVGNVWSVKCVWLNRFGDPRETEYDIRLIHHFIPNELNARLKAVQNAA